MIKSKYSLQEVVNIIIDLSKESIKNERNQVQHNTISFNNKVCKFLRVQSTRYLKLKEAIHSRASEIGYLSNHTQLKM